MDVELRMVSPETMERLKTAAVQGLLVTSALAAAAPVFHASAVHYLSGPNQVEGPKGRKRSVNPGQYPVNVVTGALRRSQAVVLPGRRGLSQCQLALVNSAVYAGVVHDGRGRGQPRPFMLNALWDEASALETEITKLFKERL